MMRLSRLAPLLALAALTACAEEDADTAGQGGGPSDAGATSDTGALPDGGMATDGSAMPDVPEPEVACDDAQAGVLAMVSTLTFARELAPGQVEGLNIDGHVSTERTEDGCFKADFVSPEGEPGIDSQFSTLLPTLEAVGGDAIEGLVQSAINNGELLLGVELWGVDDLQNDACVTARIVRGTGQPALGADGFLLSGQTYERDIEAPGSDLGQVAIVDGILEAGPFDLALPLQVLDRQILLNIREARLRINFAEPTGWSGVMAGGVQVAEIEQLAADVGETIGGVLLTVVRNAADLQPDEAGVCQGLSATLLFDARDGYFFE
jgi:hypothetical protein